MTWRAPVVESDGRWAVSLARTAAVGAIRSTACGPRASRARNRLASRDVDDDPAATWSTPSSSAKPTALSISARPTPRRRKAGEHVRRDDLDGRLEVERRERRDLQQHRPRELAVVLGDHEPGAGVGLGRCDHLLDVVDLLLVVDAAQGLSPELREERGVGADGLTQGDQRATHPTAFLVPVGR